MHFSQALYHWATYPTLEKQSQVKPSQAQSSPAQKNPNLRWGGGQGWRGGVGKSVISLNCLGRPWTWDPPTPASRVTEITCMCYYAWLKIQKPTHQKIKSLNRYCQIIFQQGCSVLILLTSKYRVHIFLHPRRT